MSDAALFWNAVALEVQRRDYTYHDAYGEDEGSTSMDRQVLMPEQSGPTHVSRAMAMMHLAMFDAAHTIKKVDIGSSAQISAYLPSVKEALPATPSGVSRGAAIGAAAGSVLKQLFTRQHIYIDQQLKLWEGSLFERGDSRASINQGKHFGGAIGDLYFDHRKMDNSDKSIADPAYSSKDLPGVFRPDPFMPTQNILGAGWGNVTPFCIGDMKAVEEGFVPPQGKAGLGKYLGGENWPADLAEIRAKGAADGTAGLTRTAEETVVGIFWGYDGSRGIGVPTRLYNQCVRSISEASNLSEDQNLVLFATVNMVMADAGIAAWREKFKYHVGRPVTVIREAGTGFGPDQSPSPGNPTTPSLGSSNPTFETGRLEIPIPVTDYDGIDAWLKTTPTVPSMVAGDITWSPLGAPQTNTSGAYTRTPPFPAYPSGHATFGAACFESVRRALAAFRLPWDCAFVMKSDELNGVNTDAHGDTRPIHRRSMTLAQAIHESAVSRLYLGVHWRMDAVEGVRLGLDVLEKAAAAGRGPASLLTPTPSNG